MLPGYFETMGIPILQRRDHTADDAGSDHPVIVLSRSLVDSVFPGQDPLSRRVSVYNAVKDPLSCEVIGVVEDIRMTAVGMEPYPQMYLPMPRSRVRA